MEEKEKITTENPIKYLGEYGRTGGPGRPKGVPNKFTQIKERILALYDEPGVEDRLKDFMKTPRGAKEAAKDLIVPLLPKDPQIDLSQNININVVNYGSPSSSPRI